MSTTVDTTQMSAVAFSAQQQEDIRALVTRYPQPLSALLPVLHMAQQHFGYLPMNVQQLVADTLNVTLMQVREVVTFYTMFKEQPTGTYLMEVCTNVSCMLNGAVELLDHMCNTLGIQPGETTPDGLFTLAEVECAGACGSAPVVQVNNIYHEKVTAETMDALITNIQTGAETGGVA
ncbi:MAG: NAD(P)H-dependent oxidoreductase subunit E [Mariprofundaceae bacterium]|nr:NAD(P)H-dependent oxidoreductase subunit E [Mariprofundaceae bacterium]